MAYRWLSVGPMLGKGSVALFIALYAGCAVDAETELDQDPAGDGKGDVYGTDDRKERYQFATTSLTHRLARSSAMLAMRGLVKPRPDGNYELFEPRTLAQTGVCADERFAQQPEVGYCSATLVAPDLVVTSGHCVMNAISGLGGAQHKCESTYIVFDFAYDTRPTDPVAALRVLPKDDVYQCAEVLAAESPDSGGLPKQDYAILRLDRPVQGRAAVPVYGGDDLATGSRGIQIGRRVRREARRRWPRPHSGSPTRAWQWLHKAQFPSRAIDATVMVRSNRHASHHDHRTGRDDRS
jgi:hypothetical protein